MTERKRIYAIYAFNGFSEHVRVMRKPLYTDYKKAEMNCSEHEWVEDVTDAYYS